MEDNQQTFTAESSELISFGDAAKKLNISGEELKSRIASGNLRAFVFSTTRTSFVEVGTRELDQQIFGRSEEMSLWLKDPLSDGSQLFQESGKLHSLKDFYLLKASLGNYRLHSVMVRIDQTYEVLCKVSGIDKKYIVSRDAGRILEFLLKESASGRTVFSTNDLLREIGKDPVNDKLPDVFKATEAKELFHFVVKQLEKGKYRLHE